MVRYQLSVIGYQISGLPVPRSSFFVLRWGSGKRLADEFLELKAESSKRRARSPTILLTHRP
jgi:hypothetical protein